MVLPKSRKGSWVFIGLVNYYCNMWKIVSQILRYLTNIMSSKEKFKYIENKRKKFD